MERDICEECILSCENGGLTCNSEDLGGLHQNTFVLPTISKACSDSVESALKSRRCERFKIELCYSTSPKKSIYSKYLSRLTESGPKAFLSYGIELILAGVDCGFCKKELESINLTDDDMCLARAMVQRIKEALEAGSPYEPNLNDADRSKLEYLISVLGGLRKAA